MIGTLGMSISAFCQWVFIYQRYRFIELKVPNIWRVNYFNYLLGCVSAFGCLGVAAFERVHNVWVHFVWAIIAFVGYNIYLLINTWWIDPRIEKADVQYKRGLLRCLISMVGPVCVVSIFIVPSGWLAISILEIILIIGFLSWFLTMIGSFGNTKFKIIIESSDAMEMGLLRDVGRSPGNSR